VSHNIFKLFAAGFSLVFGIYFSAPSLSALTLEEIRQTPNLTPQRFARFFSNFKYIYRAELQKTEDFLAAQAGDCDDYAMLADRVLREKSYTTRIIIVRMATETHAVCYVEQTHCYLDYNNRGCLLRTVSCGNSIEEIAKKVARSFGEPWAMVSEYESVNGRQQLVSSQMPGGIPVVARQQLASRDIEKKTIN
jgi:hypothetical protein